MINEFDFAHPDPEMIAACEAALGYEFRDKNWLVKGLTHASIAQTRLQSNERMEFLGDAILGMVVCDRLFALFPEDEEGQMTQMKSDVVSRSACAQLTMTLGLDQFVLMGKGLHQSREIPLSVLAGVFESVVAAIYLDGGYEAAFQFISGKLEALIRHAGETAHIRNSKSRLQQLTQKVQGKTPTYELLDEAGPDHSKFFLVSAIVGETSYPSAWGANKKEAEQKAALNALCTLQGARVPYSQNDLPMSTMTAPVEENSGDSAEDQINLEDQASPEEQVNQTASETVAAEAGLSEVLEDQLATSSAAAEETDPAETDPVDLRATHKVSDSEGVV